MKKSIAINPAVKTFLAACKNEEVSYTKNADNCNLLIAAVVALSGSKEALTSKTFPTAYFDACITAEVWPMVINDKGKIVALARNDAAKQKNFYGLQLVRVRNYLYNTVEKPLRDAEKAEAEAKQAKQFEAMCKGKTDQEIEELKQVATVAKTATKQADMATALLSTFASPDDMFCFLFDFCTEKGLKVTYGNIIEVAKIPKKRIAKV